MLRSIIASTAAGLALSVGVLAMPAEGAKTIGIVSHVPYGVKTSNGTIKPWHTKWGYNRNDTISTGSHRFIVATLGGGETTSCLPKNKTYRIGPIDTGKANQLVIKPC